MNARDDLRAAILAQNPTKEQRAAIFSEESEFLLRASPGSGKTWTSCRRFIWRGADWPHRFGGLALLSFTNIAIREFRTATIDMGRRGLLSDPNYVGTFDAFVERFIIGPFGHLIAGTEKRPKLFAGPRPGDFRDATLKVWMDGKGNTKRPVPAWEIVPYLDGETPRFRTSTSFGSKPLVMPKDNAVGRLLSRGFYTHAQRVFWASRLLSHRPRIAEVLARRFPEIIVDEAQDTNEWLLVLLKLLRSKGSKIVLVGDPDQCIYEFSMADADSLPKLREEWGIPEKPLTRSFRCNNFISAAVRNIGGTPSFTGCGDGTSEWHGAFIVREGSTTFSDGVSFLQSFSTRAGMDLDSAAVICRGRQQLESIKGHANYSNLQGKTNELAVAAFLRDCRHDYRGAYRRVARTVRELTGDDPLWEQIDSAPDLLGDLDVASSVWRFVRDRNRLPPVSQASGEWVVSGARGPGGAHQRDRARV